MPLVTERCSLRAFNLLSATDANAVSALGTGRKDGMYVRQIVFLQILTKLRRLDGCRHVVREVRRRKRYVSVRILSRNGCELSVRNIPNYDIIRVFTVKLVRNTYGCRTA